jgi:hypothetical protein
MPTYTNAQYIYNIVTGSDDTISVMISGVRSWVPVDIGNTDYDNMMLLVNEGKLVIAPAK